MIRHNFARWRRASGKCRVFSYFCGMDWIQNFLFEHSAVQAVVVMALIIFTGLALGRIRVAGISLGVTFVFFMGIFAGYLGFTIDDQMLNYAESFGLVLFVYALGLQVGPGFFSSFSQRRNPHEWREFDIDRGPGAAWAVGIGMLCHYGIDDMTGVLFAELRPTPLRLRQPNRP